MKLIASVILSLSLLELFHCVPLITDDGGLKETNTSSSWGLHGGVNAGLGLEAGLKNGVGVLGIKKNLSGDIGGDKAHSEKETKYAINPVLAQNNPSIGSVYYPAPGPVYYPAPGPVYYPGAGSPNYQTTGPQYYPAPGAPYNNQFATMPVQQLPTPYGQQAPQTQFPVSSQYTQQGYVPQPAPQQNTPQGGPQQYYQGAQLYAPVPQYAPAAAPQYAPAPQYASAPQSAQGVPQST